MSNKTIFLLVSFILFFSCKEGDRCESKTTEFVYPQDLKQLESENYICNAQELDISIEVMQQAKKLFEDSNYLLIKIDDHYRGVFDKKNKMWAVFYSGEVNNFSNDGSVYGIYFFYLFDENFDIVYSSRFDRENEKIIHHIHKHDTNGYEDLFQIEFKKPIVKWTEITYKDLLEIYKMANTNQYNIVEKICRKESDKCNWYYGY